MRRFLFAIFMAATAFGTWAISPVLNVAYYAMEANDLQRAHEICGQNKLNGVDVMQTNITYYIDDYEDMLGLVTTPDGNTLRQIDTFVDDNMKDVKSQLINMGFKAVGDNDNSHIVTRSGEKLNMRGVYEKGNVKCTLFNSKKGVTAVFTRR